MKYGLAGVLSDRTIHFLSNHTTLNSKLAKSHKNTETSKMDSSPIMFTSRKFPVSRVS